MGKEQEYSISYYTGERKKQGSKTVVAVLTVNETGKQYRGIAHCNPIDTFNQEIGKRIAGSRARKQYFKAQTNEAFTNYELAKKILESAEKYAEKKAALYFREENWLANYLTTV